MAHQIVHAMDSAWVTAPLPALQATIDTHTTIGGNAIGGNAIGGNAIGGNAIGGNRASNRLTGQSGAQNTVATYTPALPVDLTAFDELRFWVRSNRAAHGNRSLPFYLELVFVDANDEPADEHRWFIPINRAGQWEQRRIGIENERRSAITSFQLRALTDLPFTCFIDELLAVREELLTDLETALITHLALPVQMPGLHNITLRQTTLVGSDQLALPHFPGFHSGNQLLLQTGGTAAIRTVIQVDHDVNANTTTLQVNTPVTTELAAGIATVSLLIPAVMEAPPFSLPSVPPITTPSAIPAPSPALYITFLDAREHLERTGYYLQRDSFRPRGTVIVCSTRPAPRAYTADYQLTAVAPNREQQRFIQQHLLHHFATDIGLPINGYPSPVQMLAPPELERRQLGELAPLYLRVGTRLECAPRAEQTWVRITEIQASHPDAPLDRETVTLEFERDGT